MIKKNKIFRLIGILLVLAFPLNSGGFVVHAQTDASNPDLVYFNDFDGTPIVMSGVTASLAGVTSLESVQDHDGYGFGGDFLRNSTGGYDDGGIGTPGSPTTLTLVGLPPHTSININFLLAIIDSWDGSVPGEGEGACTDCHPDIFTVTVDGTPIFSESFGYMSPSFTPSPGVLLTEYTPLGFNPDFDDAAYNMGLYPAFDDIPHSANTLTIEWFASGDGWQGGYDESWAIENLEINLFEEHPAEWATMQVEINYDWVTGFDWPLGSWVTLTIDDPDTENPVDYFDEKEVVYDENCWMSSCVRFDFWDNFNVEPDHIVTLTDGVTTKRHKAFDIKITDIGTHTVEGLAEPGSELFVMAHDPCWEYNRASAEDGAWTATFVCDLETVEWVDAAKYSEDGSYTSYFVGPTYVHSVGFWWDEITVHTLDEIVLRTGWAACTPGLVTALQHASQIDITINGEPLYPDGAELLHWNSIEPFELDGCTAAPQGNQASVSGWTYDLGSLEPGIYEIYVHWQLTHPVLDGGDWDGDGKLDKAEGTIVENTITIIVK